MLLDWTIKKKSCILQIREDLEEFSERVTKEKINYNHLSDQS